MLWGAAQNDFASLQPWTPEARKEVEEWQAKGFRSLANALGFDGDADRAYEHLIGDRALPDHDWSDIWRKVGIPPPEDPREREAIEAQFAGLYERLRGLEPPTRYEDPRNYPDMALLLAAVLDHLTERGTPVQEVPLIATLPSGDINAQIRRIPGVPTIILFEHGLFRFFIDMANILGWTVESLTALQIGDDDALTKLNRVRLIPPQASEYFLGSLYAYAVHGSPLANENSVPKPPENELLALNLAANMRRFVMVHELTHCVAGHLDMEHSKELEHVADGEAANLVSEMAREKPGSWAVGFWACDFALTAIHFLEKTIGLMAYGDRRLNWISETHPDPLRRRIWVRERAPNTEGVTAGNIKAAEALCGMTDGLFGHLWKITCPLLYKHHLDGARPAELWQSHLKHSFAPE